MIKALKRLNEALPGLLLGIAVYGLLVQFIGIGLVLPVRSGWVFTSPW